GHNRQDDWGHGAQGCASRVQPRPALVREALTSKGGQAGGIGQRRPADEEPGHWPADILQQSCVIGKLQLTIGVEEIGDGEPGDSYSQASERAVQRGCASWAEEQQRSGYGQGEVAEWIGQRDGLLDQSASQSG